MANKRVKGVKRNVLEIKHIELKEANEFVGLYHRHHKPVVGHRFSIGCFSGSKLVGVAIVGRPIARRIDQHSTVEVLRCCTDGTKNACKALGYERIITYILETESGTSLRASGWNYAYTNCGGSWNVASQPRKVSAPTIPKKLYESRLR